MGLNSNSSIVYQGWIKVYRGMDEQERSFEHFDQYREISGLQL